MDRNIFRGAIAAVVLLFAFAVFMEGSGFSESGTTSQRKPSPLGFSLPRPALVLQPGRSPASPGIESAGPDTVEACVFFTDFEGVNTGWTTTGFWHELNNPQTIAVLTDHVLNDPPNDINPDLVTFPNPDPNGDVFLPAAFSGSRIFWYGVDDNGTFIDNPFNLSIQTAKNGGQSTAANSGDLISPLIDLTSVTQASLSFKTFWQIEGVDVNSFDLMEVAVSTDNGETFTRLGLINPIDDANAPRDIGYSSGGLNQAPVWIEPLFDLTSFVGQQIRLRFRFSTGDALYNGFQGWGIDDICVRSSALPGPVVQSVNPTCVQLSNITTTLVHVLGANFANGGTVTVGGQVVPSVGFVSHDELLINLPSALGVGAFDITVTNPDGQSSTLTNAISVAELCSISVSLPNVPADVNGDGLIDEADYRMVSLPGILTPDNPDPLAVFAGPAAQYDPSRFGIYSYDTPAGAYTQYPSVPLASAGLGYWFISTQTTSAGATGIPVSTSQPFVVSLPPGWSMVGQPFQEQTAWQNVLVRATTGAGPVEVPIGDVNNIWVEQQAWGYLSGYFAVNVTSGTLAPWSSYWVRNVSNTTVDLLLPPPVAAFAPVAADAALSSSAASVGTQTAPKGISFSLWERLKRYQDRTLFLGLHPKGLPGADSMDCLAPPPVSTQAPRIYVNHSQWRKRPGKYAVDIRPTGRYPTRFVLTVDVPVRSVRKGYVLAWKGLGTLPSTLEALLIDPATGKTIDMRSKSAYTFVAPARRAHYRLEVLLR